MDARINSQGFNPEFAFKKRIAMDERRLVGAVGFEPTTSSAQGWRAARLRYTPSEWRKSYLFNSSL